MVKGAQALIESLRREGVTHVFGYAGATICEAVDALAASDIGYTLVRTEQNAGHMASGYARMSGKVGVCMVTSGPGATNLITGIATAYMDSIPMVAITGQVESHLLGRDIFQEVDITGAVAPFIKHSYLVKDAREIPRVVKEAFHIASTGRQGPVLIDIPSDVQKKEIDPVYPESVDIRGYKPSYRGNVVQIRRVAEAIGQSKRPVICAGGGIFSAGARQELKELAESAGIPVVTTMMGLGVLPTDHPLNMGMIGSFGNTCANKALAKSDLLILAGARVANRAILSPSEIGRRMRTIHMDVDPAEIGKNVSTNIPVVGDIRCILGQVLEHNPHVDSGEWIDILRQKRAEELAAEIMPLKAGVHPGKVMRSLGRQMAENACVCVDVGQNQIWACKYLPLREGRFLTTGGLGTMGYALPAAIGAKVACPDRQTVVVCGDGGFQMAFNELATLVSQGSDIKIVLLENHVLGLVNEIQKKSYSGPFGVSLDGSPDFGILAQAYGIAFGRVDADQDIDEAVGRMLAHKGPYILCCGVDADTTTGD